LIINKYTRSGLKIELPLKHALLLDSVPFLDGEIWY